MCPTGTSTIQSQQKSNLRSAFEILDTDGDGKISYEDLRASYGGSLSNPDTIVSMISEADSNKNGYVEYEEFENVLNARTRRNGGVMEDAFKVMDKDGDGKVGREDLKSYLKWAGFEARDEDVEAMIILGGGTGHDDDDGVTFEGWLRILSV